MIHSTSPPYSAENTLKNLSLTAILLYENRYYIIDESFNGVDIESNILIQEILQHLKQQGKTIVISSHIYVTLIPLCNEIHLL